MYKVSDTVHSSEYMPESFEAMVLKETERVKPILKEQFLKEYILGIGDAEETLEIYCRAFGIDRKKPVRMIALRPRDVSSDESLFFIRNTALECFTNESLLLSTVIGTSAVLLTDITDSQELFKTVKKTINLIRQCDESEVAAVYGSMGPLEDAPQMYERLSNGLAYFFYGDSTEILYEGDFTQEGNAGDIKPDYGAIERTIKSGDKEKTQELLEEFFTALRTASPVPAVAKTYCLELYVCMIRCCRTEMMEKYMKGIVTVQELGSFREIRRFISEKAKEIVAVNEPKEVKIYSSLIKETVDIIDKNLSNENLSLRWLAGTILYTNVDYLGKLFKKETGQNFSHYVMEKRMEMAKKLIVSGSRDRIYEVAEKVGYGSNSQYFSQVFKKYTGISPLEYKEFARLSGKNAI
ncbi:MAG: helix-turn-helix domain-containing protein [Clostridiales bacterium]|nr:helix-turn-helix domain-containing protein [Clostridiales bacterium]